MTVLPATLNIKVAPFQVLHFLSESHTADENGLILNVPYDAAMVMILDEAHPAREATEAEVNAPIGEAPEKPALATKPAAKPAEPKNPPAAE